MALAAGLEIALDVRDVLAELRPKLAVVDCMLPAGLAAGEAMGTPTVSLVHFPYGLARTQMLRGSGAWTTDRSQLGVPVESSPEEIASALIELLARPQYREAARRAAVAIAADMPDETAAAALSGLADLAAS
jgi:hypothetical protein